MEDGRCFDSLIILSGPSFTYPVDKYPGGYVPACVDKLFYRLENVLEE